MILLDTHAALWMTEGVPVLGPTARKTIDAAITEDRLVLSAFSFWEIAMLVAKRRLTMTVPASRYRQRTLALGVREVPFTGDIGIAAVDLTDLPGDPADRIIVATALALEATLITADERMLAWPGPLLRQDARL